MENGIRVFSIRVACSSLLAGLMISGLPPAPTHAQSTQDWALRACKNEVGSRIADLPLSEITVQASTPDGDGNAIINWRSTRGSLGFCRVNRQGNVTQFKVEEMARPVGPDNEQDPVEAGYVTTCRAEAASRLAVRESDVFVHVSTRNSDDTELDWRTRRGSSGACRVDRRGRLAEFEMYRNNDERSGSGGPAAQPSLPYAQRAAYDSGHSWGQDDDRSNRSRSHQRYSDLYTSETEAMFRKGYEDGFDRRAKDYRLPQAQPGTGAKPSGEIRPGRYVIESVASSKVLDLRNEDGTTVQQWSGSLISRKNQLWDIEDARYGYFYIRSTENGKALTAGGQTNGSPVQAMPLANRREQQWRIKVLASGEIQLLSRSGLALDLPDGKRDNGLRLQLWQEHGRDNQRFRLKPSS